MTQAPAEVNAVESRQRMKDHTELLVRTWLPAPDGGEPRGTVILVHGMAEHSGSYPHVAKVLTDLGLRVRAFDLRGHGKTSKPDCCYDRFTFAFDLRLLLDALGVKQADVYGTSLGSIIAQAFADQAQLQHQDPLDPKSGSDMVAQLAQLTLVAQRTPPQERDAVRSAFLAVPAAERDSWLKRQAGQ